VYALTHTGIGLLAGGHDPRREVALVSARSASRCKLDAFYAFQRALVLIQHHTSAPAPPLCAHVLPSSSSSSSLPGLAVLASRMMQSFALPLSLSLSFFAFRARCNRAFSTKTYNFRSREHPAIALFDAADDRKRNRTVVRSHGICSAWTIRRARARACRRCVINFQGYR